MGLGLERACRGDRGLVRRVGWLALLVAGSGWTFLWVGISHGDVFCGGGPVDCPSLLGEAPRYLTLLGIVVPAVAIGVALYGERIAPRFLGISAVVAASIGLALVIAMTVADYDVMLSSHTSGRLDVRYRPPVFPLVVRSLSALWPLFIGGWTTLISLQLLRRGLPVAIAVLGVLVGFSIVVTMPFATEYVVYRNLLPLELIVSLVWATSVGIYLTTVKGTIATA
jgi:hypothetical protein